MGNIPIPVLAITLAVALRGVAEASAASVAGASVPGYQVAEPKAIAAIPDLFFEDAKPAIDAVVKPMTTAAAEGERMSSRANVVEPKIVSGMEDARARDPVPAGVSAPAPAGDLLAAVPTAEAAVVNDVPDVGESGWYAGGALGRGGYDAGYGRTVQTLLSTGATSVWVTPDAKDTMGKVYAGFRFSPHWAVEAGYWDFGRIGYAAAIYAPSVASLERRFRAHGVGGDVVARMPLSSTFAALGRLGFVVVSASASAGVPVPGGGLAALPRQSSANVSLHWGLGGEYRVNPAWWMRFEYEEVLRGGETRKFGTADVKLWTLGAAYRF